MTMSKEEQEAYERRLQHRLEILRKQIEAGKVKIAKGLHVAESLKRVRYAKDGSVDLSTVDGLVRSMALAVEVVHDRAEKKKALPLVEIQSAYFTLLDQGFGEFYKVMRDRGLTPHDAGVALSRKPESATEVVKNLPDFLEVIKLFWRECGEAAHAHVEDMNNSLKGVFGGDLFPSQSQNIASKCGLYTDTIVLPDPFLRSLILFERASQQQRAYYLIKHGLNLLQYRDLACADVQPPIVVILPDVTALDDAEKQFIYEQSQRSSLAHAERVFGRTFASIDELTEYTGQLDTIEKAAAAVADETRLLFDTDWEGSTREQLARAATDTHAQLIGSDHPGLLIASTAVGRLSTSNELLVKARRLGGTPIIDAPTSWQYFVWKLEYDARSAEEDFHVENLHVLRGLQAIAEGQMEWLGNVPADALIEIRKTGAIKEIRSVLGTGVEELATADPANFEKTTVQVLDNIHNAFDDHRKRIAELTAKKWRFAGSDIGSWLVVGSMAITAAATGTPIWGLAAIAADQLLDAPKLKDIPKSIRELAIEAQEIKKSPVGMLFRYADDQQ